MHSLSTLPAHDNFNPDIDVPDCLQKYLTTVEDPKDLYSSIRENRAHRAQLLTRRFYNQIQYGCKNSACHVPTCLSYRKRVATGPVRLHNEVTARALAVRCVERYAHRGRDIDRRPKRDKNKKSSLQPTIGPDDGLCYSDPVVPWYADASEYLSKKKSAARREGSILQTKSLQKKDTVPQNSSSDGVPAHLNGEPVRKSDREDVSTDEDSKHDNDHDSISNTASSASSMDVSPPSPPIEIKARLDTSSLTQSLFNAPAMVGAVNGAAWLQALTAEPTSEHDGNNVEMNKDGNVTNIARPTLKTSAVRGLGTARTFSLLPASVLLYLKDLMTTKENLANEDLSYTSQIEQFVDQSIFHVLTNPHRLLSSASTWNEFVPYSMVTGLPTDFVSLAKLETCNTIGTIPLVLPDWHRVCWICETVLYGYRSNQQQSSVYAHLQQLLRHAYISPPWLGGSSQSARGAYLDNRTVAYLISLMINIAFGTLQLTLDHRFSQPDFYPFVPSPPDEWVFQPDIMQLAVNIADTFTYRHSLDLASTCKIGSSPDIYTSKKVGVIHNLVEILSDSKLESHRYEGHNEHTSSLFDMMSAVVFMRWDRSAIISRNCPVAGALEVLRRLYQMRKQCHLLQSRFIMHFISEALDELEMPYEWLEFRPDPERIHILQYPFLLPDESLVAYFRSINLKVMKQSYDRAMGTYTIGNAQLLLGKWHVRNVHEVLQKTRPHMARYFVMTVRREHMLEDAIGQIWHREHQELLRPLKVRMGEEDGEVGLDHGGVQQELFRLMFNEAFNPDYGMFDMDLKTRMTWFKPGSLEPTYKYEALGLLISLAVYNGITIPMNMPQALYRIILGLKVKTTEHIEDGWPQLARGFEELLTWKEGDVGDVMCRTYEFCYEVFGKVKSVDMTRTRSTDYTDFANDDSKINSGSDVSEEAPLVTNANREAFVKDYISHLTSKSVQPQLQAFLKGVRTLLSPQALSLLPPERLKVLFEGHPATQSIDLPAWKATTCYEDYTVSDPVIAWFWEVLTEDFSQEQLRKLLEFVTASDRIPIGGWNGITFIIQRNAAGNEWLPASSTCYGRLFLPEYSSKEILKAKLEKAIETNYGFGMV